MKILRFLERVLPLFFWLFLIFAFDDSSFAIMTLIAALIHEAGHMIFGLTRGVLRVMPAPSATGFKISPEKTLSYKDDLLLTLGGPVLNLTVFFVLFFLKCFMGIATGLSVFSTVNLLTALSNLLPIKGHDGYRAIENVLLLYSENHERARSALSAFSFFFTALLMFLSLFLMLKLGEGYWIFVIFFSSFIGELTKTVKYGVF